MLAAAVLHLIEEYGFPGGFLRWMRATVGFAPNAVEAIVLNALFLLLVATPTPPIVVQSVPILLLTNGAVHVVSTVVTKRYSPGVITSVLLFFPLGIRVLMTQTISGTGILLGIAWMLVPLAVVSLRRSVTRR